MKKLILLAACVAAASGAFAQWTGGVKGGWNISKLTHVGADMRPGYYVGAFAEYRYAFRLLGIQPEVLYSRQGADLGDRQWVKSSYLAVPVLLKIHPSNRFSFDVGPQFGFALRYKACYDPGDGTLVTRRLPKEDFNTFDVSLALGLSWLLSPSIEFSARYDVGLTNTDGGVGRSDGEAVRNGVLRIGAGVRLGGHTFRAMYGTPDSIRE